MWAHKLQEAVGLGGVGGRRQRSQLSKMAEAGEAHVSATVRPGTSVS